MKLITLNYDGTNYSGWQRQINALTIQEVVEDSLSKLYKEEIKVLGASRTDGGVHALDQKASFYAPDNIPIDKIPYALNRHLPEDILCVDAIEVEEGFNPICNAKNKTYRYRILNSKFNNPFLKKYAWHINRAIDVEKMKIAGSYFVGEYDFRGFCSDGTGAKTFVRKINFLEIKKDGDIIDIWINGDGFLYNMVRIIVGTLVDVGVGKTNENEILGIIESKDRGNAGITAPAKGLMLMEIVY